jgi:flagellar protein FlaG
MKNLQPQGAKEPNPDISVEQLKADVDMGDKMLKQLRSLLEFEIFNDTGILMVRIKDSQSGEVIRTMPPQEYLILKGKLKAFIGILLNEKI